MKQRLASLLATAGLIAGMAFVSVGVPAASATSTPGNPDNLGTDFWLAFPGNVPTPTLTLLIIGPTATSGTVEAPGLTPAFIMPFTVTPGAVTYVSVPDTLDIQSSEAVEHLGIHVTADQEVAAYGMNQALFSSDGYLGLPTDTLGREYIVEGYLNAGELHGSQFVVVATQNATTVTINPTITTNAHQAGTPYNVPLNQGETYQLRGGISGADVSGSIVTADKPIAVFGGHQCAAAGGGPCNHLVEQMTPTSAWGTTFMTQPFATRIGGDIFRYMASANHTVVSVDGSPVATLDRGTFFEQTLTAASVVTSDKPILVAQYMQDGVFNQFNGDRFETIVPSVDEFLTSYTLATPAWGFLSNFINVVAPTATLASVTLDSIPVPAGSFTEIPGSTYSGAQLAVALGAHTLSGSQPLGAVVYGLANSDAYGYPGGLSFGSPRPVVTTLTLAPKTDSNPVNTEACVTATVQDQSGLLMSGVGVGFTVTGANPTSGSVDTTADGTAQFCYTGTNPGEDAIAAVVGTVGDDATKHWSPVNDGQTISALGDLHGWIGLKNSDDQGTPFDLRVELLKNGTPVPGVEGLQRCITGVVRSPTLAKEAVVAWNPFSPVSVDSGDVLSVRLSARAGTKPNNTNCSAHGSAVGLRFYYDAESRPSRFAATIGADQSVDLYLHSNGAMCNNTESPGVTSRWLNTTVSVGDLPGRCKDSGVIKYGGGNAWSTISTWSLAPLP